MTEDLTAVIYHCETCGRDFDDTDELNEDAYGYICPECGGLYVVAVRT